MSDNPYSSPETLPNKNGSVGVSESKATVPTPSGSAVMTARLSVMMFLQFFAWGAWFATLGLAMTNGGLAGSIGGAYESAPIAAIFAPLFLGLLAESG